MTEIFVEIDKLENHIIEFSESEGMYCIRKNGIAIVKFTEYGVYSNGLFPMYNSREEQFMMLDDESGEIFTLGKNVNWLSGFQYQGSGQKYLANDYRSNAIREERTGVVTIRIEKSEKAESSLDPQVYQTRVKEDGDDVSFEVVMDGENYLSELKKIKYIRIFGTGNTMKTVNIVPMGKKYTSDNRKIKNNLIVLQGVSDHFGVIDVRTSKEIAPAKFTKITVFPGFVQATTSDGTKEEFSFNLD